MATKNVQLKNGGGDLLMPFTNQAALTTPVVPKEPADAPAYNFYINGNTLKWVETDAGKANCAIRKVNKDELIIVTANPTNDAIIYFLDDISNMANNADADLTSWASTSITITKGTISSIRVLSDCYLYILNYASSNTLIRLPTSVERYIPTKYCGIYPKLHQVSTVGHLNADNTREVFVNSANIVLIVNQTTITIPAATEIPYKFLTQSQIQVITYDPDEIFVFKPWVDIRADDIVIATVQVVGGKVQKFIYSPIDARVDGFKTIPPTYYSYQGEKPVIKSNRFTREIVATLPTFGSTYTGLHQAMGVWDRYAVLLTYNDNVTPKTSTAILYDVGNENKLAEINLPYGSYARPHGNACVFSNVFKQSSSFLPLMYVSQWEENSERGVLVYDITKSGSTYSATLVQTIIPNVSATSFGSGAVDWVIDADNGKLYSVAYKATGGSYIENDTTNPTMICEFNLPDLSDGATVTLGDADVIAVYTAESTPFRQGSIFIDGKIVIQAGIINYPTWMWVKFFDLQSEKITTKVPLDQWGGEPEGIAIYRDSLVMGWRNDQNIYKIIFD